MRALYLGLCRCVGFVTGDAQLDEAVDDRIRNVVVRLELLSCYPALVTRIALPGLPIETA